MRTKKPDDLPRLHLRYLEHDVRELSQRLRSLDAHAAWEREHGRCLTDAAAEAMEHTRNLLAIAERAAKRVREAL